jgi:hypothetical protein
MSPPRQCHGIPSAAAWRRRVGSRNGRQTIEEVLMTLAEEKTERGGFDLVILPGRIANKRAPHVGTSAMLIIRCALKEFACRRDRIIEVALGLRVGLRPSGKAVIVRKRSRPFGGRLADRHLPF